MIIDLHTHSHYSSDGKLTIPELLDYYSKGDIVGLTDHETIGGWDEFKAEAEKRGIRPVLGVEWFAGEHHILSYFLNGVPDDFISYMVERRNKEKKCMENVYAVCKKKYNGLPLYEELMKMQPHPEMILSVPALANEISKVSDMHFKDAVHNIRSIRRSLPEDKQQEIFFANEIIQKINSWGAVSILAHPYYEKGVELTNNDVKKKIRLFLQYGIQGVEVFSGKADKNIQDFLLSICEDLRLLPSIGSDFHYQIKNLNQAEGLRRVKGNIGLKFHDQGKGLNPKYLREIDFDLIKRIKKWVINKSR